MKRCIEVALLVFMGLLVSTEVWAESPKHISGSIRIFLQGKTGGSGNIYLQRVSGSITNGGVGSSWENLHDNIDVTYRVISTREGHFKIAAHYTIINIDTHPTTEHTVDLMLPVLEKEPSEANFVCVEGGVETFACLSDHPIDN